MKFGVILPHTKLYGGVKRFLELGNIFYAQGHCFTLFTPEPSTPIEWFNYNGSYDVLDNIRHHCLDVLFFTEACFAEKAVASDAKRIIYYLVSKKTNLGYLKKWSRIEFFANSSDMLHFAKENGIQAFPAIGGINLELYPASGIKDISHPIGDSFTVMAYGRLGKRKKGTHIVVKACELLRFFKQDIRLILFDSPTDEKSANCIANFKTSVPYKFILNHPPTQNQELYKMADAFVNAEKGGGWSNTTIEAMASGVPVISCKYATNDFLIHKKTGIKVRRNSFAIAWAIYRMKKNYNLHLEYRNNAIEEIKVFNWIHLAERILNHLTTVSGKEAVKHDILSEVDESIKI